MTNSSSAPALTPPVRPRFHPGQLLTADDLSDIVSWTRANIDLNRWRDGWGVATGTAVTVVPGKPLSLRIGAGYSIDPMGRNIVVSKPVTVDLSKKLSELSVSGAPQRGAVDLILTYVEEAAKPRPALGQGACVTTDDCAFTRTDEGFDISIVAVPERTESDDAATGDAIAAWRRGFERCLDVANRYRDRFVGPELRDPSGETAAAFLNEALDERPLSMLPAVAQDIAVLKEMASVPEEAVVPVLFGIISDYRLTYAAAPALDSDVPSGVPLARIRLEERRTSDGAAVLAIDAIDTAPPYRRVLSRTPLPAPVGMVNAAPVIGQDVDAAGGWFATHGVEPAWYAAFDLSRVTTVQDLISALDFDPYVGRWDKPIVQYIALEGETRQALRIVSYRSTIGAEISNLHVTRSAQGYPASPGNPVTLVYKVRNTGRTRLTVSVTDNLFDDDESRVVSGLLIDPGDEAETTVTFDVPTGLPDPGPDGRVTLLSEIVATGQPDGGDPVISREDGNLMVFVPISIWVSHNVMEVVKLAEEKVTHLIGVKNRGASRLTVNVQMIVGRDTIDLGTQELEPGKEETFKRIIVIPKGASGPFFVDAAVEATSPDGRKVVTMASHTMLIDTGVPSIAKVFAWLWMISFGWIARFFGAFFGIFKR